MGLEDTVKQRGEQLLQRIRLLTEQEIRDFVSELLTAADKERASVLDDSRRVAQAEQARAVLEESARVRGEVEQAWPAKLREARAAADARQATELREAQKLADRQLSEKVTSVRAEGQRVLEAALASARQEAEAEAVAVALAVPEPPPIDDAVSRMRDGIRRLDRVSRLTDALDALGELAAHEASRAAVLTVQDDRLRGWVFTAFEPALGPAHQVEMELGEAGLVGHAVVTGQTQSLVSGPDGVPAGVAPTFAALPAGVGAMAVPVIVGGQVMAVLYGDDAASEPAAAWRESLEILASHAGLCMEALTAARAAQLAGQAMPAPMVEANGPTFPFDDVAGAHPESDA